MNTFQILTSKPRFDLMHCNVSIDPDKWPIFGRFLTSSEASCFRRYGWAYPVQNSL
jgi:hypothetical protein